MARHYQGYSEAVERVRDQSLEEDLDLIDNLFGREDLSYGATPEDVKKEALDQLDREWTDWEWEKENGSFLEAYIALHSSGR